MTKGMSDHMINTTKGAVDSIEVERIIAEFDGIAQVAVIGIPHAKFGESVHAIVVPYAGKKITAQQVLTLCHDRIADYRCPRSITIRTDPLPRIQSGEIARAELRSAYW